MMRWVGELLVPVQYTRSFPVVLRTTCGQTIFVRAVCHRPKLLESVLVYITRLIQNPLCPTEISKCFFQPSLTNAFTEHFRVPSVLLPYFHMW